MQTMFLRSTKVTFFVVLILVNSVYMGTEGRPLSTAETGKAVAAGGDVVFFDWLALGGIKSSGPSDGGAGHKFTNSATLGGIKTTGPSGPGVGH
ncbi:PAMP-induced secreted peptide 2-like [Prosopis cineraria]|uniref:PAMP-induced secreted peptide 2-like n=1 Tax=Prosopis cineraria TaxID=364024 RepID=UPI00240F8214|nr:PAMP-induced secreted peptide 2-like [Prosopis cineraria]